MDTKIFLEKKPVLKKALSATFNVWILVLILGFTFSQLFYVHYTLLVSSLIIFGISIIAGVIGFVVSYLYYLYAIKKTIAVPKKKRISGRK